MSQLIVLNFEGDDGATTWTEEAQGLSPSINYGVEIDTSDPLFGSSSLLFPGDKSCRIKYNLPSEITGDLTLHCKIRFAGLSAWAGDMSWADVIWLIDESGNAEVNLFGYGATPVELGRFITDSAHNIIVDNSTSNPFSEDTVHHVAFIAHGRDLMYAVDGIIQATWTASIDNPLSGLDAIYFDTSVLPPGVDFWIDAVELVNYAKWTSDFTPPTSAPFVDITTAEVPCAEIEVTAHAPYRHASVPVAEIAINTYAPDFGPLFADIEAAEIDVLARTPSYEWTVPEMAIHPTTGRPYGRMKTAKIIYYCILTGGGVSDVYVPISSFQADIEENEDGYTTTLSCSIPGSAIYADAIDDIIDARDTAIATAQATLSAGWNYWKAWVADEETQEAVEAELDEVMETGLDSAWTYDDDAVAWQSAYGGMTMYVRNYVATVAALGGKISIRKGYRFLDGTEQTEEIIRVDYDSVQISQDPKSDTATMTGSITEELPSAKDRTIGPVTFYGLETDGKRRIRADVDLFLRIGDTCIYGTGGEDYMTVGKISYTVSANPPEATMEVTEA